MDSLKTCIKAKNQGMKKQLLMATALLACGFTFAQQNEKAPPPPPKVDLRELPSPPPPPEAPKPPELLMTNEYAAFLKRNKDVRQLQRDEEQVTIKLKSGKSEVYNLNNKEEAKKLEAKYGELPDPGDMPPPAPPPPPPAPQKPSKQQ